MLAERQLQIEVLLDDQGHTTLAGHLVARGLCGIAGIFGEGGLEPAPAREGNGEVVMRKRNVPWSRLTRRSSTRGNYRVALGWGAAKSANFLDRLPCNWITAVGNVSYER